LHAKRETERGHNQAAVLARELARATGLELDELVLIRRAHTERHRAGMDARARRDSVAGAFEVLLPKHICDRRVLLIDDVFTTGATRFRVRGGFEIGRRLPTFSYWTIRASLNVFTNLTGVTFCTNGTSISLPSN
jgi:hypothetical protein